MKPTQRVPDDQRCLCCGKTADSKEHFVPGWLARKSGQFSLPMVFGISSAGKISNQSGLGNSGEAYRKNLCCSCNRGFGRGLEKDVMGLLTPLVGAGPEIELASCCNSWLDRERLLVCWWAILRAMELDELTNIRGVDSTTKLRIWSQLAIVRDGCIPALPDHIFVECARAVEPQWGFLISRQVFDFERGAVMTNGSFLWAMHVNHFLLMVAHVPDAVPFRARGWGYSLNPAGSFREGVYPNLRTMIELSAFDTRLPKLYRFKN